MGNDIDNKQEEEFYREVVTQVINGKHPFTFAYQLHARSEGGENFILKSAEVLTRFPHYKCKPVLPHKFFTCLTEMAKETKEPIEKKFVYLQLDRLGNELADNIDELGSNFTASFNISANILNEEFKKKYLSVIKKHPKLSQKNFALELTEYSPFPIGKDQKKEYKEFLGVMQSLQRGGTLFSLDDFDTDYADERALKAFPWDIVKTDHHKFKTVMNQMLDPSFAKYHDNNVLDTLIASLEFLLANGNGIPKKIVCEGLSEGSCQGGKDKNIPLLLSKYYGKKFKLLGYNKNTLLYQGYEINIPCNMEKMKKMLTGKHQLAI